jgi:dienelactone hydrolase
LGASTLGLQSTISSSGASPNNIVNPNPTVQPQSGPVTVNVTTSTYQGIPYDLYYPSNYSGSLVILAGGILGEKHYLAGWGERIAQSGYAALAFTTKQENLQHVPDYVVNCRSNLEKMISFVYNSSAFPIPVNFNSVSLMGMSGGGATVLSMNDGRIRTTIAVCPYYINNLTAENEQPVLIITGQNDYFAPHDTHGAVYYQELKPSKMIVEQANNPDQDGHDITDAGWKYTFAWLDYFVGNNDDASSTIANVSNDPSILDYDGVFP